MPAPAQVAEQESLAKALRDHSTESGRPLSELVEESPVLLVFLRHFACAFCAMTIDRISQVEAQIAARGVRPVFVHLGSPERAKPYFDYYHLSAVERVSNPDASLYQHPAFQLSRKHFMAHFLVPKVWKSWLGGAWKKYGVGMVKDDGHQMPGVFFLKNGRIANAFRHKTIADEPDFLEIIDKGR